MSAAAPHDGFLRACHRGVVEARLFVPEGRVAAVVGTLLEVEGVTAPVGSLCQVSAVAGQAIEAEVVGFRDTRLRLMPLREPIGVAPGAVVRPSGSADLAPRGAACLGRVLDGRGLPIDGGPPVREHGSVPLFHRPGRPLARRRIDAPLDVGVRAINALSTVGRGSRIGLFAGSGVGKSTLLGQITRFTRADAVVVALVGERSREVREFVERELGEALARAAVVVATSDEAPILRRRAAIVATAIAEDLRAEGRHVLLLVDSLTRFCTAQREIGLAAGEPPATRGFPPSVWSTLPRLLERAGTTEGEGSVTGIYTVLVEGDDLAEPVADAARALLDGHVVLSRQLAERGQHPAIDPLGSISRVMGDVTAPDAQALATRARQLLAAHREAEDLISIGAYVPGSSPLVDEARRLHEPLLRFLGQRRDEASSLTESVHGLARVLGGATP